MSAEKHILILDDHLDILDTLKELFEGEGYRVTTLQGCENIIETVQQVCPDIVIVDYILNGINGGEYCHQLKINPATSAIPVIILSGYPMILKSLGDYGADAIISKPFDLDTLSDFVKNALKKGNL